MCDHPGSLQQRRSFRQRFGLRLDFRHGLGERVGTRQLWFERFVDDA
jgi:hypothetical protein